VQGAAGGTFIARVAAVDHDAGDAGHVTCTLNHETGAPRMFTLLPVSVAHSNAEYRLVTHADAEFDREVSYRVKFIHFGQH